MDLQTLKNAALWVCWRHKERNGKTTKPPINPHTGQYARVNNPSDWADYETAVRAAGDRGLAGVGVMCAPSLSLCGIDIDNVTPENKALAEQIIAQMDSYTETSPSGNGYHILFTADLVRVPKVGVDGRYYCRHPSAGLECYIAGQTNRYLTYTGQAINSKGINSRTDALLDFLDTHMPKNAPGEIRANSVGRNTIQMPMADDEILSKARNAKSRDKFIALYDHGDLSLHNGDHSKADASLCAILAFWFAKDAAKIDYYFRQSALYREKWEREDYRHQTINEAIANCGSVYKPPKDGSKKQRWQRRPRHLLPHLRPRL